jgi:hypothetical protein
MIALFERVTKMIEKKKILTIPGVLISLIKLVIVNLVDSSGFNPKLLE